MTLPCSLLSLSSRLDREWSDLLEIQLWCLLGSSNWWSWNSVSSKPVFNKQSFILALRMKEWKWDQPLCHPYDLLLKQLLPTSVTSGSFWSQKKGYFTDTTIRMLQKWKLKLPSFHFDLPMLLKQQGMNAATLLSEWQILISKWKLSCPDMVGKEKLSVCCLKENGSHRLM